MEEMYRPGEYAKLYPKNARKGYLANKHNAKTIEKLIKHHLVSKPDRVI